MSKLNYIVKMSLDGSGLQSGLKGAQAAVQSFVSKLRSIGGLIAGVFAAGGIKAFADECIAANKAQMDSEIKLQTVMRQRMKATDEEVQSIKNLASAQQNLGVVGDEVQLAGAQQVATFLNSKKSMETLMPAMNNLLAQQKGLNATQGDAVNVANMFGKVMTGQTGALKKVGITFTAAEEAALKFGKEEDRAAVLAKIITNNVGEMNKALAETDEGKMQQLANNIGDMKEQIGAALVPILAEFAPGVGDMAQSITDKLVAVLNFIKSNLATLASWVVSLLASIGIQKFFTKISAASAANMAKLQGHADAAAVRAQADEEKVLKTKQRIEVLKAQAAEAEGAKELAIRQRLANAEEQLAAQTTAAKKSLAEKAAADQALAAEQSKRAWSRNMAAAKTAVAGFVASAKSMMKSFILTAIITAAFEAIMKLVSVMKTSNASFQKMSGVVKELCSKALNWVVKQLDTLFTWLGSIEEETGAVSGTFQVLGAIIMAVFHVCMLQVKAAGAVLQGLGNIVNDVATAFSALANGDWSGAKAAIGKIGGDFSAMWNKVKSDGSEAFAAIKSDFSSAFAAFDTSAAAVAGRKANMGKYVGGGGSGGNGGGGGKSTGKHGTTKTDKTPAQQAAEDVKEAEKAYAAAIADAKRQLKQGLIKEAEYEAEVLKAIESKYDAYAKALDDTSDQKYKAELDKVAEEIKKQRGVIKSRTDKEEVLAYLADQENDEIQKHISAIDNAVKALREQAEVEAKGRDRSGDWKITGKDRDQQIAKLDLQYDLENAKKTLDILKTAVANGADGFAAELEAQMQKVSSLEDALNLSEALAKVKELKQELQKTTLESIEQGWSTIQGLADGIKNTLEKLKDPDATGWEKLCAVMQELFAILSAVQTVMQTINTIQELSNSLTLAHAAAQGADTAATTGNAIAKTADAAASGADAKAKAADATAALVDASAQGVDAAASGTNTAAKAGEAIAGATAAGSSMPFPMNIVAIAAGIAAVVGAIAMIATTKKKAQKFSTGGTVQGSFAHGDFVPAWLNAGETVLTPNQGNRLLNLADGKASPAASKSIPDHIYLHADGRELSACIDTNARHNARM